MSTVQHPLAQPLSRTRLALASACVALWAAASLPALAASAEPAAIATAAGCSIVEVSNVRPQQGSLMVAAYADAQSFGKKPLVAIRVPAGDATTQRFQICGLVGNQVALMLFQDLDDDGRLARNVMGVPTEPWGSSGKPGMFGPNWESGQVPLDGKPIAVAMSI